MGMSRFIKDVILATWSLSGGKQAARLSSTYDLPNDYERIYFWHIRKTAGTSINRAFLALATTDPLELHKRMLNTLNKRVVGDGRSYVAHNRYLIQQGRYYYAFAHHPWHEITLPPKTFMITCFRDPVKRAVSHYRMLVGMQREQRDTHSTRREGHWAAGSLTEFVERTPKDHLLRQLYMFSEHFDIDQAVERIASCAFVLQTERLSDDLAQLSEVLNVPLKSRQERTSPTDVQISDAELATLREIMEPEYELLRRVDSLNTQVRNQPVEAADLASGD